MRKAALASPGGILGVDGELEVTPPTVDLGALIFQAGVHLGVRGVPAVKQGQDALERFFCEEARADSVTQG